MTDDLKGKIADLVQCISKDEKMPTTRKDLADMLGLSDRDCRRLREEAINNGFPIITSPSFSGAFLSYSDEYTYMCEREATAIAMKWLKRAKSFRRIRENKGQVRL